MTQIEVLTVQKERRISLPELAFEPEQRPACRWRIDPESGRPMLEWFMAERSSVSL